MPPCKAVLNIPSMPPRSYSPRMPKARATSLYTSLQQMDEAVSVPSIQMYGRAGRIDLVE